MPSSYIADALAAIESLSATDSFDASLTPAAKRIRRSTSSLTVVSEHSSQQSVCSSAVNTPKLQGLIPKPLERDARHHKIVCMLMRQQRETNALKRKHSDLETTTALATSLVQQHSSELHGRHIASNISFSLAFPKTGPLASTRIAGAFHGVKHTFGP